MRAKVTEVTVHRAAPNTEITAEIDLGRFKELYGEEDLKRLLENGFTGDAIGQGRYYQARLIRGA